jgi:hypothetical protein
MSETEYPFPKEEFEDEIGIYRYFRKESHSENENTVLQSMV